MDPVETIFVSLWEGLKSIGRFLEKIFGALAAALVWLAKNFTFIILMAVVGFVLYFLLKIFNAEQAQAAA